MWSDHQHGFGPSLRRAFNLNNRRPRALLAGANDEGHCNGRSAARYFNHLKIFALIKIHAFASRSKEDVSGHLRLIPSVDVRPESLRIEFFVRVERGRSWQQQ